MLLWPDGDVSEAWATSEIADVRDKVAIVTGATSGLGFAAARELASQRAHIVLTAKTVEKGSRFACHVMHAFTKSVNNFRLSTEGLFDLVLEKLLQWVPMSRPVPPPVSNPTRRPTRGFTITHSICLTHLTCALQSCGGAQKNGACCFN